MPFLNTKQFSYEHFILEVKFENELIILERDIAAKFDKEVNSHFTLQEYDKEAVEYVGEKNIKAAIELNRIIIAGDKMPLPSFSQLASLFTSTGLKVFCDNKFSNFNFRVASINKKNSLQEALNGYYNLSNVDKKEVDNIGRIIGFEHEVVLRLKDNMDCNIIFIPATRNKDTKGKQADEFGIMTKVNCCYKGAAIEKKSIDTLLKQAINNLEEKIYPFIETVR